MADILLLASDPSLLRLLEFLPRHSVTVVHSPEEVPAAVERRRFALVVIMNFGVGPWQAFAAIPAKRDYPAMFLSGYVDAAIEKDCALKQIPWFPAPDRRPTARPRALPRR